MDKYLLLIKGDKELSANKMKLYEKKEVIKHWNTWVKKLKKDGVLVTGSLLSSGGQAFYLSGKAENVPDNYEMASEVINGFCVVNVKSEEIAMNIARSCPVLRNELASCEIRELKTTI